MKAIQLTDFGIENLQLAEIDPPAPGADEVLVKIEAVSLNALDPAVAKGFYNPALTFPFIPVADGAGVVAATGSNVTRWKQGDRVTVHFIQGWLNGHKTPEVSRYKLGVELPGVLAEYVCLPAKSLVRTPDYLSSEEASTLPVAGLTAWVGLVDYAGIRIGQTVLTQGTGGVSIFALQIAKAAGARVIATTGADGKVERLKALGADEVINYKKFPQWQDEVKRLTGGAGVDAVLDVVGGASVNQSIQSLKPDGFVGLVGLLDSPAIPLDLLGAIATNARIRAVSVGSLEHFEAFTAALDVTRIKPVIDRVFPIEETLEAFRYLESGAHMGKVVIRL